MRLLTRLQALETRHRPTREPSLRIVLVDADGRWWEHDQEINPESVTPGTRLILLRYRATETPRCA